MKSSLEVVAVYTDHSPEIKLDTFLRDQGDNKLYISSLMKCTYLI